MEEAIDISSDNVGPALTIPLSVSQRRYYVSPGTSPPSLSSGQSIYSGNLHSPHSQPSSASSYKEDVLSPTRQPFDGAVVMSDTYLNEPTIKTYSPFKHNSACQFSPTPLTGEPYQHPPQLPHNYVALRDDTNSSFIRVYHTNGGDNKGKRYADDNINLYKGQAPICYQQIQQTPITRRHNTSRIKHCSKAPSPTSRAVIGNFLSTESPSSTYRYTNTPWRNGKVEYHQRNIQYHPAQQLVEDREDEYDDDIYTLTTKDKYLRITQDPRICQVTNLEKGCCPKGQAPCYLGELRGGAPSQYATTETSTRSSQKLTIDESPPEAFPSSVPYIGPHPSPPVVYRRLYDRLGPVVFPYPPLLGVSTPRGELRLWEKESERTLSQNSSKRKVNIAIWLSPYEPTCSFPVAVKYVEDANTKDGRSVMREIECHSFIYQKLSRLMQDGGYDRLEDAWPCAELLGYYLDKKNPGISVLITRKLSGPDLFDIIRAEHNSKFGKGHEAYGYHKLQWCILALKRISQYGRLGIRHNDIKPDNIVLDYYYDQKTNEKLFDVKIIDLGTASMHQAKDFTGGTTWYESPEQKLLEFYTKKHKNTEAAKLVDIGILSDAWGAGLSISEVLMGRRVVDVMKCPHGPGPLEYEGDDRGWVLHPSQWVQQTRQTLLLNRDHVFPVCAEAAKYVFESLVLPRPQDRAHIVEVIPYLEKLAEQYLNELKCKHKFKQGT